MTRDAWRALGNVLRYIWPALGAAREAGLDIELFPVSAFPGPLVEGQPVGVMAPFTFVMAHADRHDQWVSPPLPVPEDASYFQSMRRREVES